MNLIYYNHEIFFRNLSFLTLLGHHRNYTNKMYCVILCKLGIRKCCDILLIIFKRESPNEFYQAIVLSMSTKITIYCKKEEATNTLMV